MPVEFECINCRAKIRVADEAADQQARCPFCRSIQSIPFSAIRSVDHEQAQSPYRETSPLPPPPPSSPTQSANPYAAPTVDATVTNEWVERFNLATPAERFLGVLIDYLFFFVCSLPGLAIEGLFGTVGIRIPEDVSGLLLFGGWLAYYAIQWTMIGSSGQTMGKRFLKTRIIDMEGAPPGFFRGVVLRYWVLGIVSGPMSCVCFPVGLVFPIVDGLFVFGDRRQCLHDMVASTLVVSDRDANRDADRDLDNE